MSDRADVAEDLITGFGSLTATLTAARRELEGEAGAAGGSSPTDDVPATLLTGFLGSGKTTVVQRLLAGEHGLRISAIINDLAEVNVDALALDDAWSRDQRTAGEIARLQLSNGCACCELSDDLMASLTAAADPKDAAGGDRQRPDAIVVEASGGGDPVPMAAAIHAAPGIGLDGIVCVADAAAIVDQLEHPSLGRLARRQLEAAHLVLLSKIDLVPVDVTASATRTIGQLSPGRPVLPIAGGRVEPAVLLSAALRGAALPLTGPSPQKSIATRSITPGPIDLARLARWLEHDPGLLRAKGWVVDKDRRTHALQVVGRRWTLSPAASEHDPVLVLIASDANAVDRAAGEIERLAG